MFPRLLGTKMVLAPLVPVHGESRAEGFEEIFPSPRQVCYKDCWYEKLARVSTEGLEAKNRADHPRDVCYLFRSLYNSLLIQAAASEYALKLTNGVLCFLNAVMQSQRQLPVPSLSQVFFLN